MSFDILDRIFSVKNDQDFNGIALEIFHYQYDHNKVYRSFVQSLGTEISSISHYENIPSLPIEFFKNHAVISGTFIPQQEFVSSGTTSTSTSKHYIADIEVYKRSFLQAFSLYFGNIEDYIVLGLLPSYLERKGSSLVFMVDELIRLSQHSYSGFYLNDHKSLNTMLIQADKTKRKILLIGVSFALLDFCEQYPQSNPRLILMETGGMKGRRKEMTREELHILLKSGYGVDRIYSEYGMTELLSQAYSKGGGIFYPPPWMKVLIRESEDPLTLMKTGNSGGINLIDLANLHSCSFLATQDLGKINADGSFEILGRFDSSDVRGCNLMAL